MKYNLTMKSGITREFTNYHDYSKAHEAYTIVDSRRSLPRIITEEMKEAEVVQEQELKIEQPEILVELETETENK